MKAMAGVPFDDPVIGAERLYELGLIG